MQLLKARITHFRSVEDSEEFSLDRVACLVGKNEAGKSAILTALTALNPHPATPVSLDKERDYPRRYLTQYAERHKDQEAVVVTTTWKLDEDQIRSIQSEFGPNALASGEVQILRRYNAKDVEINPQPNLEAIFKHLFDDAKLAADERAPLKAAKNTNQLVEALSKIESQTEKQKALLAKLKGFGSVTNKINQIVRAHLPAMLYFSNYDRMDGAVQIEQLQKLQTEGHIQLDSYRGQKLFLDFLGYAGVPLDEILKIGTYETFNARLQAASNNITDQILEYWSQNPHIDVAVKIEASKPGDAPPFNTGTIARARIYNQLHRVDMPFSERSAGFVWFFSFLVKFALVKDDEIPVVLLLDEPGLSLHGKAQADLLRYFDEKLSTFHQIVYSTHSPFMVSAEKLLSTRIVEDRVEKRGERFVPLGTKVHNDVLTRDPDTLFPLQGALGYEITQNLFIGKNTLLVEGPSDILYLRALSSALERLKRERLDQRWIVCPAGGIGNIRPFMSLFVGSRINAVVLADYSIGQKNKIESLRTSQLLKAGGVLTANSYADKEEADIEDLFSIDAYVELLNGCYELKGTDVVTKALLESADTKTVRLAVKAEALFKTHAAASVPSFDHYRPAEWLLLNPGFLDRKAKAITETLDRFERLFRDINALL